MTTKTHAFSATVLDLRRLDNTVAGNPVWDLTLAAGPAEAGVVMNIRTLPDASVGYSAFDWLGRRATVEVREWRGQLRVIDLRDPPAGFTVHPS
jgi:hypothetical protein